MPGRGVSRTRAAQELTVDFGDLLDVRTVRLAANVRNVTPRQRTLPWPSHSKLPCPFLGLHYGLYWAHVQPRRGCLAWSPVVALCADTRLCACLQRDASLAASSSAPPLQLSYSLQAPAPAATLAVDTPKSKHGTKKKVGRFDHGTVLSGVGGILSRLSGANISPLIAAPLRFLAFPHAVREINQYWIYQSLCVLIRPACFLCFPLPLLRIPNHFRAASLSQHRLRHDSVLCSRGCRTGRRACRNEHAAASAA